MKIKLEDFLINNGKSARPIPDKKVIDFINSAVDPTYLYHETILPDFLNAYFKWIQSSKLNKLHGLENFSALDYMHGSSQAFDFFYIKHHDKRFRVLKGDFAYHNVSWKNNMNWLYYDSYNSEVKDWLRHGDALVISLPFSDYGSEHPHTDGILSVCNSLKIPVLLDCAYHCIARDLNFDLNKYPCIDTIAFSLSKAFYGAERLRIGMRCRRTRDDDGGVIFNDFHMISKISAGVGLRLIENFEPDYTQNTFREKQLQVCDSLNLEPSNCVPFGLASKDHAEFGTYDRGTDWRRVCISRLIGNCDEIEL